MFTKAISDNTANALALLGKSSILKDAYLAGGTACALHLGHRLSFDLDFFTEKEFPTEIVLNQLKSLSGFELIQTAEWTILGSFSQVKFSYFYYPYPLIAKPKVFLGSRIASLQDIAAMKIAAICDRGTKRDFVDLYFITTRYSLDEILKFYDEKYNKLANNLPHILRSLSYFENAEGEKLKMIEEVSWENVKEYFTEEVKSLWKKLLE